MNVSKIAPYAKAIAAIAGAIVTTATLVSDGEVSTDDFTAIITAWVTAFGVYQVTNASIVKKV